MANQSIKNRTGANVSRNNDKELRKLFEAALVDLAALRSVVNNMSADANNVQVVLNNLGSAVGNLQLTANNLVNDVVKLSNNLNAPNNTVQITAVAATTNINAATLKGGTSAGALTLVA